MRPLLLSTAIGKGDELAPNRSPRRYLDLTRNASCPLGAAYLGTMRGPGEQQRFVDLIGASSYESMCEFVHYGLMKHFPVLGADVRQHQRLTGYLERERILPRLPGVSTHYDPARHASLFKVITDLFDNRQWSKPQIAACLASCGL